MLALRGPLNTFAVALCLGIAASSLLAQPRGRERSPERPRVDARELLDKILAAADPSMDDLREYVSQVSMAAWRDESLPSPAENPEALYGPEHRAYRNQWYGPLRENSKTRALLRQLVAQPPSGFTMAPMSAALCLADDPDVADLEALIGGYRALDASSFSQGSFARHLGRAIAALRTTASPEADALVATGLELLREHAATGRPVQRGAAIEGLLRAGETSEALALLETLVDEDTSGAAAVLPVLQACSRAFLLPQVDPSFKARAIELARAAADAALEAPEASPRAGGGLSEEAKLFRAGVSFLQDVAAEASFDFLLACQEDPRARRLLDMDSLQGVRSALQRERANATPERRARLDAFYRDTLVAAGERLFALEEEPMDTEEYQEFFQGRDLRYNAAAYFSELWRRAEDVRAIWANDPESVELLGTLVLAASDESEGELHNKLYSAVREKLETRVLTADLLAKIRRDLGIECRVDLYRELVGILAAEIGATNEARAALAVSVLKGAHPPSLQLPLARTPSDGFVQDRALVALRVLGYEITVKNDEKVVAIVWSGKPAADTDDDRGE
ncbi:MAG: hypothetical protein AB1486_05860 [Planctomycetota bacterium]